MTPYQMIKDEEVYLLERLKKDVATQIQNQVQNFIDKTGMNVRQVSFSFIDTTTIDGVKSAVFQHIHVYKEHL